MLSDLAARLRALLFRKAAEDDLDEELRYHLERHLEQSRARGIPAEEASRLAMLEFGGMEPVKEECRDAWGTALVESWLSDFRYAARLLRKSPVFTSVAVFSLAIGIGSNTAVFSLLDRVMFRPLPVEDPHRLVIPRYSQNGRVSNFSYPLFREMERQQTALDGMFATSDFPLKDMVVRGGTTSATAAGRLVTGSYFDVLRIRPAAGRMLNEGDDRTGVPGAAVISDRYWEREFHRDPAALGQTLRVSQAHLTIVGVAPPDFFGEKPGAAPDLYIPMSQQPKVAPSDLLEARFATWLTVMGRLRADTTREQAASALTRLAGDLVHLTVQSAGAHPTIVLEDGSRGLDELRRDFSKPLWVLMAMVALVLLIACFNVANLLLVRGSARAHELAVRQALGADRMRLVRQFLAESILLSLLGASLGVALAWWSSQALVRLVAEGRELAIPVVLDWRMLAFTGVAAVAATVLFGLLPAWVISGLRPAVSRTLVSRIRGLMIPQIAVSMVVISGAGFLTRSLATLRHQDFGIRPMHLLMVKLPLELTPGAMKWQGVLRDELPERIRQLPGVMRAAVSCCGPFDDVAHSGPVVGEGAPGAESETTRIVHVSPGYFETMGMTIIAGRPLNPADRTGSARVAVLSETAAARMFGGVRAVGKRISLGRQFDPEKSMEVVGVTKDARFAGPREEFRVLVFVPMAQQSAPVTSVSIRTAEAPATIAQAVRHILQQLVPNIDIGAIETLDAIIENKLHSERMLSFLSSLFAVQTLVLAGIGLYGLTAFAAVSRRREIGIRMALGAQRTQVVAMIFRGTAILLAAGTALGVTGALAAGYAMRSLLFGVAANDAFTLAAAGALLGSVGLVAAFWPAWGAASAEALEALRNE